ncbi:MAG: hypothetical protein GKR93_13795 [Gammaproteobacteria bacterium]|nr:hypothetical protein [Gammaproteobacteria bacterium]
MNFIIDEPPPSAQILKQERNLLTAEIKRLTLRDTITTFVIMTFSSVILGLIVFWQTGNLRYTGMSVAVFPVLGTILSLLGITKSTGFRSAANSISGLQNDLVGLSPIANTSIKDVETLAKRHKSVNAYHQQIIEQDRETVNAELAMYWEFDSSTMANTARGRDLVNKAKERIVS